MTSARLNKIALLVLLLLLVLPVYAFAATLNGEATATPSTITKAGDTVTVNVTVTNTGDDTEYPVTLQDASGNTITAFGDSGSTLIRKDGKFTASFDHAVTDEEISDGRLTLVLCYQMEEDGEIQKYEKRIYAPITYDGTIVALEVTREIKPEVARKGDAVSIIYTLHNTGTVDLTGIKLQEIITKDAQTVKTLGAGQTTSLTFNVKMGSADLASAAEIRYKANGKEETQTVAQKTIPTANAGLSVSAACKQDSVNVGDTATLVITFENKGNIDYSNITVSDAKQGVLLSGLSVSAGATEVFEKDMVLEGPTDFKLNITMDDNTGRTGAALNNAASLTVNAYDPDKAILLSLNLSSDSTSVPDFPATVLFTLDITNNSNVTAKNIQINHGSTRITSVSELAPGKTVTVKRNVSASAAGKFRFTASCSDELRNNVSFDSNEIVISKATVTATAAPTSIPYPEVPVQKDTGSIMAEANTRYQNLSRIMQVVLLVLLGLFIVCLTLLIIAIILRIVKKIHRSKAVDHIELEEIRDCREEADPDRKSESTPAETHETRVYHDDEPSVNMEDDSITIGAAPEGDGEGAYRIQKGSAKASAAPQQKDEASQSSPAPVRQNPIVLNSAQQASRNSNDADSKTEEAVATGIVQPPKRHPVKRTPSDENE